MKVIVVLFLVISTALCTPSLMQVTKFESQAEMGFNDVVDLIKGLIESLNMNHDIESLKDCILEIPEVILRFKYLIEEIKNLDWKNIEMIFELFIRLFDALKEVFVGLKPCSHIPADFEAIIKKLSNFNFDKMLQRILKNGFEIFRLITEGIKMLQEKNFYGFGKNIGQVVFIFILSDEAGKANLMIDFLTGFLVGIHEQKDIKELLKCLNDLEPIIEKIIEALKLISQLKWESLRKGVALLLAALKEFSEKLTPCLSGFEQLKKLLKAIAHADVLKIITKIMSNPTPYIFSIMDCVNSIKNGNYTQAGKAFGNVLYMLFLEDSLKMNFNDVVRLIEGFLTGINQKHNFNNIEECLKLIPEIIEIVTKIIEEFRDMDWKDIEKIISVFLKIADSFKEIILAIKPCSQTPKEFEDIINKIINVDVSKLLDKVMKNMFQLVSYITNLIKHIQEAKFYEVGLEAGSIVYLVFLLE